MTSRWSEVVSHSILAQDLDVIILELASLVPRLGGDPHGLFSLKLGRGGRRRLLDEDPDDAH